MASVALPEVKQGECCPNCKRPLRTTVFGGVIEEQYYSSELVGRAVDPLEVRGPTLDEGAN